MMDCELYQTEMYSWRPESDPKTFQLLFRHLESCTDCARQFERLTAQDAVIRRTFQKLPESPLLERKILAGLAHQRADTRAPRTVWRAWLLLPIAAVVLLVIALGVRPMFQRKELRGAVASLLSAPPALQIVSSDRNELLRWSAGAISHVPALPPELHRVQFRGAAALRIAGHQAVLLKMKNEPRASLLILDASLVRQHSPMEMAEKDGSAALWTDQHSTYVLLFQGNTQDMHAYMEKMGISA